jgi:hypothetical protein
LSSRNSFDALVKIIVVLSQVTNLFMTSCAGIFDVKRWAVMCSNHAWRGKLDEADNCSILKKGATHELSPADSAQVEPHLAAIA